MNLSELYVDDELRRIEQERERSPRSALRWRLEWLALTNHPRRPVLAWLGNRLIGLGERLQSWSMPTPQQVLPE